MRQEPTNSLLQEFESCQKVWKEKVEKGEMTKEAAVSALLIKAQQIILSLKVPESWESDEYGYMAQDYN